MEYKDLKFEIIEGTFSVFKLPSQDSLLDVVSKGMFYTISKTDNEISVVCERQILPAACQEDIRDIENDFKMIRIVGKLDFKLVGILAYVSNLLAENNISIFVTSTFDTDYILVKTYNIDKVIKILKGSGHEVLIKE